MMWKRFFVERVFFWIKLTMTIIINWILFWWSFLKRLLLTNYFLLCLWSSLFWILRWDFVFTVFICRAIFFTILRFATFTFFRTIFFRRYSCKTSKKLFARKLFDINFDHCSFKISRYAINWAIDWLLRWWNNLIFCFTTIIRSLMKLICSFKKSQNCSQKKIDFAVSLNRNRYFCQTQSSFETLLLNKNLTKLIQWKSFS
jgi:predicted neutral ceramidase superfamily lipid hydrolase